MSGPVSIASRTSATPSREDSNAVKRPLREAGQLWPLALGAIELICFFPLSMAVSGFQVSA